MTGRDEKKTAIILLGHGSRRREANEGLVEMARKVGRLLGCEVTPAFMAHDKPSLPEAVQGKIDQGAERIVIMPFFLFRGVHVAVDIHEEIAGIKAKYPDVDIVFTKELGPDDSIALLVSKRIMGAIEA